MAQNKDFPALTDKQVRFCEEYVIDLNATQAAIRAGYSEKTARQIGEQNLSKLDIREYVKTLQKKTSDALNITRESQLKFYEYVKRKALSFDSFPPALKAAERQDKLLGLEAAIKTEVVNRTEYTDEELDEAIAKTEKKIKDAEGGK